MRRRTLRLTTTGALTKVAAVTALLLMATVIPSAPAFAEDDLTAPTPPMTEPIEGASAALVDDPLSYASDVTAPLPDATPLEPTHADLQLTTQPEGAEPTPPPTSTDPADIETSPATPDPSAAPTPEPPATSTPAPAPTDTPAPTATPDVDAADRHADPAAFVKKTVAEPADETIPVPLEQPTPVGETGISVAAQPSDNPAAVAETVSVDVLSKADAASRGLTGLVLQLARTDGETTAAPVAVTIPDTVLEAYYGADYAGRAQWVTVPTGTTAKRATAPSESVTATSDGEAKTTTITPQVSATPMLVTAAAAPVSTTGTGSFAATSLKPASTWDVSGQTGGFSWSLPLRTPPAAAGPAPSLSLNYDSQSVDGETASTNNQPSAIGEGWNLGGGGYIERSYVSCSQDSPAPITTSGDLCWKTDNATLNLGGHSNLLVKDTATGVWKLQNDDGSRIEYLTGTAAGHCASNGTWDNDCWKLTTTDGTQYYFGLNHLPGWSSGKTSTNSAWTVPVFGNDAGEPCHDTFPATGCMQGWRWNLDYIVDTHKNAEALYYTAETNSYNANGGAAISYIRGGQLEHIDYGLTATTVYAANAATDKVTFGYDSYGRCNDTTHANCTTETIAAAAVTPAHPTAYPDIPFDQLCTTGCTDLISPTFWTTGMLNTITTKARISGAYANVDIWTLSHSFPLPGDTSSPALWLTRVGHTGYSGSTSIADPDTSFDGAPMQNRVWVKDGLLPLDKWRVTGIHTSAGAVISVNYLAQECTDAMAADILAHPESNTHRCFPQWWSPKLTSTTSLPMKKDLFHKYVVSSVINNPATGGGNDLAQETDYSYGTPAWRFDNSPLIPTDKQTWSDYAGFNTVEIRKGDPNTPASQELTKYTFYQGMDGDKASPAGGTKTVAVTGYASVPDSRWFAGRTRDVKTYNGTAVISTTVTTPWASTITASDGTNTAWMSGDGTVVTTEPLSTSGNRTTTTTTTYDPAYGYPLTVNRASSDVTKTTCTKTDYAAPNTTAWIIGLPKEILKVGVPCSNLNAAEYPADAISQNRITYDSSGFDGVPTAGDPTLGQVVTSYDSNGLPVWATSATNAYDTMGRIVSSKDIANHTTTTAYTPAAGAAAGSGALTSVTTTNTAPFNWTTTATYNPAWGAQTSATDENGKLTTATYDALGRRTDVWLPGRPQAGNTASIHYSYTITQDSNHIVDGPMAVATTTLVPGSTVTSWTLYDGLGQEVQTKATAEGGSLAITDTGYDKAGRVAMKINPYYTLNTAEPTKLFVPTSEQNIESKETTTYDAAGRPITVALISAATEKYHTTYAYPGADRVNTLPPAGAAPTSVFTNTLGQETKLVRYLASSTSSTPFTNPYTSTYEYSVQGNMTKMTDAAGSQWLWEYDTLGRQTKATDPDTGITLSSYDDAGNVTSTTDARDKTLAYTYDALNRKTGQYAGSTSSAANLVASWSYDTVTNAKNQLASSSSFSGTGSSRREYKQSITGYDDGYRPLSTTLTIPAGLSGFATATSYTTGYSYYPDGSLQNITEPAVGNPTSGGLPTEDVFYAYGGYGHVVGMYGASDILTGAIYTPIGQASQYTRESGQAVTTYDYDHATQALRRITDTKGSTTYADRTYVRDNAGNVTSATTAATSVATDTQCYTYDRFQELTAAWTPTSNNCATTPTSTTIGGPSPYWNTYAITAANGNRTSAVTKAITSGGTSTTNTYTYGGTATHAVQTVDHTTGTTTTTDTYAYDAAGNTTARPGQTITYGATGKVSKITEGSTNEYNFYDANGNLLIQTDGVHGTTVFAGDTEIHVAAGSNPGAATAVRTYSVNGTPIAERTTKAGTPTGVIRWLGTNLNGTADIEIGETDSTVTRRYTDPYGNTRGTNPTWSSAHTFLNASKSKLSDLVQLGARAYDPLLGKFLTVDPVLDPYHPQQNNGYAYASNSPITLSDPSGLHPSDNNDPRRQIDAKKRADANRDNDAAAAAGSEESDSGAGSCVGLNLSSCGSGRSGDACVSLNPSSCNPVSIPGAREQQIAAGKWWEKTFWVNVKSLGDLAIVCAMEGVSLCGPPGDALSGYAAARFAAAKAEQEAALDAAGESAALKGPGARGGESTAAARGREAHAAQEYGEGFEKEFVLENGLRPDALNFESRVVIELKPNNPRAIRLGERQLQNYIDQLNKEFPGEIPWSGWVETYVP